MPKGRRTTHRSSTGRKIYAVRDAKGRFKNVHTFERAHERDIKLRSVREK
jgi:DNA-binding protein HU-beta